MSAAKHSPGPWQWDGPVWDYDPEIDAPWLVDATDKRVLWGGIKCDSGANARLIAAAPELLDALRGYVAFAAMRRHELGELSPEMEVVDAVARAAIAKAEVQS